MKLSLFFLFLFFCLKIGAQTSYIAPTQMLHKKGYQLGISGGQFLSSEKIDSNGQKIEFQDGEKFNSTHAEVAGYYGLLENFQIGGGARFIQNNSSTFDPLTSENENESSSGIQSTFVSMMYGFKPVGKLLYTIEGLFRYMPYTNEESDASSTGALILGDQGNEISAGLGLRYSSATNNSLTVRSGYRKPGDDLSPEIYWQVEGALVWKYIALVAGGNGILSTHNDPYGNDPLKKPTYNTGNTSLYNSTGRELLAPYLGLNLAPGKSWRVEFRVSQVVSGQSTDLGTGFGISLIRRVDENKSGALDIKFKEYDFEGSITKVSPKKGYVVIDKGIGDGVQKGMKIDFFEFDYIGGNILIAQGIVVRSKSNTAIVKISRLFNTKKVLKQGIVARGSFR